MVTLVFDLYRDVVAIVGVERPRPDTAQARSIHGTGFVIAPGLLVTCWHCVREQLPDGLTYGVAYQEPGGRMKFAYLTNIFQDTNGSDLATATLEWPMPITLRLAARELETSEDVWMAGHPLSNLERHSGELWLNLQPQYLRSYITRQIRHKDHEFGDVLSYELATPAHPGLSGAPVIKRESSEVVAVIYGNNDISRVVELASVDESTGERFPQIERIVSHGLAHHTNTLRNLTGPATGMLSLSTYLERFRPAPSEALRRPEGKKALEIVDALQQKGARAVCPACRKTDLNLVPGYWSGVQVQADLTQGFSLPGQYLVCAILICPACGHVSQFHLDPLGLKP